MGKDESRLESTMDDDIARIFAKAEKRVESGCGPSEAAWQATLELFFVMMPENLAEGKSERGLSGPILPLRLENDAESAFYTFVDGKADLPPNTRGLFITPSAFENLTFSEKIRTASRHAPGNAYWLLIGDTGSYEKILHTSLPGAKHIGTDILEDGNHLANYSYHTIDECLDDLSNVIWTYFGPRVAWPEDWIIEYTENWTGKLLYNRQAGVHEDFSYLHHPELVGMDFLEAVFRAVAAVIEKDVASLENAIFITNELNSASGDDAGEVTKAGVLNGNESECREVFDRLAIEIEALLDALGETGMEIPQRKPGNSEYGNAFNTAVKSVYETVTGRDCPESICVEWGE